MMKNQKVVKTMHKAKEMVKRSYACEVRAEEEHAGRIHGLPIVYDSKTDIGGMFEEVIDRGALDKADLTDVRFLVNHDMSGIPLARSRRNNGNSTMKLTHTEKGLEIDVDLDVENNPRAKELYSAIKRGDVTGMSFCFGVNDESWENLESEYPTRHVKEISTVIEVSAVTFPAYEDTSISARDKTALGNAKEAVDTAKRNSLDKEEKEKRSQLELAKAKALAKFI